MKDQSAVTESSSNALTATVVGSLPVTIYVTTIQISLEIFSERCLYIVKYYRSIVSSESAFALAQAYKSSSVLASS